MAGILEEFPVVLAAGILEGFPVVLAVGILEGFPVVLAANAGGAANAVGAELRAVETEIEFLVGTS